MLNVRLSESGNRQKMIGSELFQRFSQTRFFQNTGKEASEQKRAAKREYHSQRCRCWNQASRATMEETRTPLFSILPFAYGYTAKERFQVHPEKMESTELYDEEKDARKTNDRTPKLRFIEPLHAK